MRINIVCIVTMKADCREPLTIRGTAPIGGEPRASDPHPVELPPRGEVQKSEGNHRGTSGGQALANFPLFELGVKICLG
jgi:hypothetical protein